MNQLTQQFPFYLSISPPFLCQARETKSTYYTLLLKMIESVTQYKGVEPNQIGKTKKIKKIW